MKRRKQSIDFIVCCVVEESDSHQAAVSFTQGIHDFYCVIVAIGHEDPSISKLSSQPSRRHAFEFDRISWRTCCEVIGDAEYRDRVRNTGEEAPSEEREKGYADMARVALAAVKNLLG